MNIGNTFEDLREDFNVLATVFLTDTASRLSIKSIAMSNIVLQRGCKWKGGVGVIFSFR